MSSNPMGAAASPPEKIGELGSTATWGAATAAGATANTATRRANVILDTNPACARSTRRREDFDRRRRWPSRVAAALHGSR